MKLYIKQKMSLFKGKLDVERYVYYEVSYTKSKICPSKCRE